LQTATAPAASKIRIHAAGSGTGDAAVDPLLGKFVCQTTTAHDSLTYFSVQLFRWPAEKAYAGKKLR
jgi:hypothetical protein